MFITFEGGEGSGKTSQIERVSDKLRHMGYQVLTTREPGGTEMGKQLRQLLLDKNNPISKRTELFLFLADRRHHLDTVIEPALEKNMIVLCDRYFDSTIVYQNYASGHQILSDSALWRLFTDIGQFRIPDITFFFDIDPEEGLKRVKSRKGESSKFDDAELSFHKNVYYGYKTLAKGSRFITLDASEDFNTITNNIIYEIKKYSFVRK